MLKNVVNSGRLNSEIAIKLNCAIHAVENGVPRAHILDGSVKHSVPFGIIYCIWRRNCYCK